jgi:2-polyprenyl-3-methyl-5-hydroxy-6-metoxy-1,4-benzoquinol methylase
MMRLTRKRYNKEYYENAVYRTKANSPRDRKRLEMLRSHKPGGELLEIGCGLGKFLELAVTHFEVHGLDISPYAVAHSQRALGARVKQGNIEEEPLPQAYYDAIVAFNILEHLKQPSRTINNVYASLKEEGVFFGSVPNNSGPVGSLYTAITNLLDKTHCSTYAPRYWRMLFQQVGFSSLSLFGEILVGKNHSAYIRNGLWKYVSLNLVFLCKK